MPLKYSHSSSAHTSTGVLGVKDQKKEGKKGGRKKTIRDYKGIKLFRKALPLVLQEDISRCPSSRMEEEKSDSGGECHETP